MKFMQRISPCALAVCLAMMSSAVQAQSGTSRRLPNLTPLPAANFSLVTDSAGRVLLRFSTTSWNNGTGPLQIEAGPVDSNRKQEVNQRVFNEDGSSEAFPAGSFTWHEGHNHFHFDDYAVYTLQPVNAPGGSARTGSKTTFCIMDTTKMNLKLPNAVKKAAYSTCGNKIQGMSVGWGDTYGSNLPGQELDMTTNPSGVYTLEITIDPQQRIWESNENDNVSCVRLDIRKPKTVTVLSSGARC